MCTWMLKRPYLDGKPELKAGERYLIGRVKLTQGYGDISRQHLVIEVENAPKPSIRITNVHGWTKLNGKQLAKTTNWLQGHRHELSLGKRSTLKIVLKWHQTGAQHKTKPETIRKPSIEPRSSPVKNFGDSCLCMGSTGR
jgi:hypothetical protein